MFMGTQSRSQTSCYPLFMAHVTSPWSTLETSIGRCVGLAVGFAPVAATRRRWRRLSAGCLFILLGRSKARVTLGTSHWVPLGDEPLVDPAVRCQLDFSDGRMPPCATLGDLPRPFRGTIAKLYPF